MKLALSTTMFAALLASPAVFGQTAPQVYDQRNQNQDTRIANGEKNGTLNSRQAARLNTDRTAINKEVKNDAAKNGGHLTPGEKAKVHHQVNKESAGIARTKDR